MLENRKVSESLGLALRGLKSGSVSQVCEAASMGLAIGWGWTEDCEGQKSEGVWMAPVSWPSLQVTFPSAANAAGKVAVVEGYGGKHEEGYQCSTQFISTCCWYRSPRSEQGLGRS